MVIILIFNTSLKKDELVHWHWVSVFWPLFLMLAVLFIASLISFFLFMAWTCTWLSGNHDSLRKHQDSNSALQCKYPSKHNLTIVSISLWLFNFCIGLFTLVLHFFVSFVETPDLVEMSKIPMLIGLGFSCCMVILTMASHKTLLNWFLQFYMPVMTS